MLQIAKLRKIFFMQAVFLQLPFNKIRIGQAQSDLTKRIQEVCFRLHEFHNALVYEKVRVLMRTEQRLFTAHKTAIIQANNVCRFVTGVVMCDVGVERNLNAISTDYLNKGTNNFETFTAQPILLLGAHPKHQI